MYFSVSSSQHADVHKAVSGSVCAQDDATEDHAHDQGDLLDVSIIFFFFFLSLYKIFLKRISRAAKSFFFAPSKKFHIEKLLRL